MTTGAKDRLVGLTKELAAHWAQTKAQWNDAKSLEFERRFMDALTAGVNTAVTNIDALERILNKVRDDCE